MLSQVDILMFENRLAVQKLHTKGLSKFQAQSLIKELSKFRNHLNCNQGILNIAKLECSLIAWCLIWHFWKYYGVANCIYLMDPV